MIQLENMISSKDFDNKISFNNFELLSSISENCSNFFNNKNLKIELSQVSNSFPAFVETKNIEEDYNTNLYIKHPTYSICCGDVCNDKLETILKGIQGISKVYLNNYRKYYIKNDIYEYRDELLKEVLCLGKTLNENELIKNSIKNALKSESIEFSIFASYCLEVKNVFIKEIDGKKYVVNPNNKDLLR